MSHSEAKEERPSKAGGLQPDIINVLLIEDNPGDARLVKEMLVDAATSRFSLTHVGLLSEGLSVLREESHQVILLDLSLPDGYGLDTVRQVCAVAPHLPVVILTGLNDETIAIRAVQEGAEDYLVKGQMDGNLLARAIRYAIERKRVEEVLRDSEERYRTILENIEDGYYETDLAGNLTAFNDSMCRISQTPKEQLTGLNNRRYMDPENARKVYHTFNEVYRTGKPYRAFDWEVARKDGSKAIVEASISLRKDASSKPVGFRGILRDITERKRTEELLRQSEEKYRTILENIEDGYYEVDLAGKYTFFNDSMCQIYGYPREEFMGISYQRYTDQETAKEVFQAYNRVYGTGEPARGFSHEIIRKDGTKGYIEASISLVKDSSGKPIGFRGIVRDVTERKQAEEAVRESEERFRQLAENIREVFYISEEGTIRYVSPAYMEIWGRAPQHLYQDPQSFFDTVHPEDKEDVRGSWQRKARVEVEQVYRIVRPDGSIRWIKDRSFPIYDDSGETLRVVAIAADITDLKLGEEKLKYLSLHDSLTGLYNRIYFEEEMSRIERGRHMAVGIVSCDVDGLKLVNDTLGHDQGDRLLVAAAGVIRGCFREGDLVARIGGDEFSVVLPDTTDSAVENACQRIQDAVADYNAANPELPLSISVGSAVSHGLDRSPKDLFKEADNNMYRKKLYRTQSVRSTIVKTLINTLKERDVTAEKHILRLEKLLVGVADSIGLPNSVRSDLSLFAKFHDIGKVGVPDSILFKEGTLTTEEWTEMKRHCEIGYRIALSAPDLIPIADWILKHHEWWNGQGYPLGIEGEEIPVECRLLAIADAYEALTSARTYRKALSHAEAVAELKEYAGTQFDPNLLTKFIQMLEAHPPELEPDTTAAL